MKWVDALIEWTARHNNGRYCIPKKGSADYDAVKRIMDANKTGKKVAEKIKAREKK